MKRIILFLYMLCILQPADATKVKILDGITVACLVAHGFQHNEMTLPKKALEDAGATVHIVSIEHGTVQAWDWYVPKATESFSVDVHIDDADASNYDALFLPGGVSGPDDLRLNKKAVDFVKQFAHKPIAAICHGPQILIDAQLIRGKTVTSWPSIKEDLKNAGGTWVDEEVVRSGNLITSRQPEDIPAFNEQMIKLFAEARNS